MRKRRNPIERRDQITKISSTADEKIKILLLPYKVVNPPTLKQRRGVVAPKDQKVYDQKYNKWVGQYRNEFLNQKIVNLIASDISPEFLLALQEDLYTYRIGIEAPYKSGQSALNNVIYKVHAETRTIVLPIPLYANRGILGISYTHEKMMSVLAKNDDKYTKTELKAYQTYNEWKQAAFTFLTRSIVEILNKSGLLEKQIRQVSEVRNKLLYVLPLELYPKAEQDWSLDIIGDCYTRINRKTFKLFVGSNTMTLVTTLPTTLGESSQRPIKEQYASRLSTQMDELRTPSEYRQKYNVSISTNPFALDNVVTFSYIVNNEQDNVSHMRQVLDSWSPNASKHILTRDFIGLDSVLSVVEEMNTYDTVKKGLANVLFQKDTANIAAITWMQDFVGGRNGKNYIQYKLGKDGIRTTSGKYVADFNQYEIIGKNLSSFSAGEHIDDTNLGETVEVVNFTIFSIPLIDKLGASLVTDEGILYANLVVCGVADTIFAFYYLPQDLYLSMNEFVLTDTQYKRAYELPITIVNYYLKTQTKAFKSPPPIYINSDDVKLIHKADTFLTIAKKLPNITLYRMPYVASEEGTFRKGDKQEITTDDIIKKASTFANRPIIASSLASKMGIVYKSPVSTSGGIFILEKPFGFDLKKLLMGMPISISGELEALKKEYNISQATQNKPLFLMYPLMPQERTGLVPSFTDIPILSYSPFNTAKALGSTYGSTLDPNFSGCTDIPTCILKYVEKQTNDGYVWQRINSPRVSQLEMIALNDRNNYTTPFNLRMGNISIHIQPTKWKTPENVFSFSSFKSDIKSIFQSDRVGFIVIDTLDFSITKQDMDRILGDTDNKYGEKTLREWADEGYSIIFTGGGAYNAQGDKKKQRQLIFYELDKQSMVNVNTPLLGTPSKTARDGNIDHIQKQARANRQINVKAAFGEFDAIGTQAKPMEAEKNKVLGGIVIFGQLEPKAMYFGGYKKTDKGEQRYLVPTLAELQATGMFVEAEFDFSVDSNLRYPLKAAPSVKEFREKIKRITGDAEIMRLLQLGIVDLNSDTYGQALSRKMVEDYPAPRSQSEKLTLNNTIQLAATRLQSTIVNTLKNLQYPQEQKNPLITFVDLNPRSTAYYQSLVNALVQAIKEIKSLHKMIGIQLRDSEIHRVRTLLGNVLNTLMQALDSKFINNNDLWIDSTQGTRKSLPQQQQEYLKLYERGKSNTADKNQLLKWMQNRIALFALQQIKQQLLQVFDEKLENSPARIFIIGKGFGEKEAKPIVERMEKELHKYQKPNIIVLDTSGTAAIIADAFDGKYPVHIIPYDQTTPRVSVKIGKFIKDFIDPTKIIVFKAKALDLTKGQKSILGEIGKDVTSFEIVKSPSPAYQRKTQPMVQTQLRSEIPVIYIIDDNLQGQKISFDVEPNKPNSTIFAYQDYSDPYDAFWIDIQARFAMQIIPVSLHESKKRLKKYKAPQNFRKGENESPVNAEKRFRRAWISASGVSAEIRNQLATSLTEDPSRKANKKSAETYLRDLLRSVNQGNSFFNNTKNMLSEARKAVEKDRYGSAGGYRDEATEFQWKVPIKIRGEVQYFDPKEYNKIRNKQINYIPKRKQLVREAAAATAINYSKFQAFDTDKEYSENLVKIGLDELSKRNERKVAKANKLRSEIASGVIDILNYDTATSYLLNYATHMFKDSPKKDSYVKIIEKIVSNIDYLSSTPRKNAAVLQTPLFSFDYLRLHRQTSLTMLESAALFALYMSFLSAQFAGLQPIELQEFVLNEAPPRDSTRYRKKIKNIIRPFLYRYSRFISVIYRYALGDIPPNVVDTISTEVINRVSIEEIYSSLRPNSEEEDQTEEAVTLLLTAGADAKSLKPKTRNLIAEYVQRGDYNSAYATLINDSYNGDVPKSLVELLNWYKLNDWISTAPDGEQKERVIQKRDSIQKELGLSDPAKWLDNNATTFLLNTTNVQPLSLYALLSPAVEKAEDGENTFRYNMHKLVDYGIRILVYVYNSTQRKDKIIMPAVEDLGNLTQEDFEEIHKALQDTTALILKS